MASKKRNGNADKNRDPITGEPGAHPIATGVGAGVGGAAAGAAGAAVGVAVAAAQGAATGAVAGPVGAAIGAVVGGVAGGLAGHAIAEQIDPSEEENYWRENYHQRPYVGENPSYDDYGPAYRYGWESRAQHSSRTFDEAETDLQSGWDRARMNSRLGWDNAKHAARDAWDRVAGRRSSMEDRPLPPKG